jgi:hypothetical protein
MFSSFNLFKIVSFKLSSYKKRIPKNNNLFLGIICTQPTPIIELFFKGP